MGPAASIGGGSTAGAASIGGGSTAGAASIGGGSTAGAASITGGGTAVLPASVEPVPGSRMLPLPASIFTVGDDDEPVPVPPPVPPPPPPLGPGGCPLASALPSSTAVPPS